MSTVAIVLNLLLSVLLVAALVVGWRVERRLQAVKDGQQQFVKSVGELNQAADRAQAGLSGLKRALAEAGVELEDRIEQARRSSRELERRIEESRSAMARLPEPQSEPQPMPLTLGDPEPVPHVGSARARRSVARSDGAPVSAVENLRRRLSAMLESRIVDDSESLTGDDVEARTPASQSSRLSARLDDDLFEEPPLSGGERRAFR